MSVQCLTRNLVTLGAEHVLVVMNGIVMEVKFHGQNRVVILSKKTSPQSYWETKKKSGVYYVAIIPL